LLPERAVPEWLTDLLFWIALLAALFFLFRWLQSRRK
jgi:hypothetical protein